MGDPLHSRPAILTYGANRSETAVFIGTNEGYLHAIDATTGNEIFSFVPPELLGTLNDHYQNPVSTNRTYGLDGDLTLWVDESLNGDIDHAYLYMGMRRGGRNYTALDVTNPAAPKYMWSINAGDLGFEKLGQTWSKPTLGTIELNGKATKVLIFGGGYDPRQDNLNVRSPDTMGNDLFIVNAESGALVTPTVSGGVIASVATDGRGGFRRFFSRPDISLVSDGDNHFLSVALGSGARSRPLGNRTNNRFYMIRQNSIYGAPDGYGMIDEEKSNELITVYRPIGELDLHNATDNLVDSTNAVIANEARGDLNESQGWRLSLLGDGEKSLAPSLTLNNEVIFTTYLPNANVGDACAPAIGGGRTYSVNVFDATPTSGTDAADRYTMLETQGIPSEPVAHINSNGEVQIIVGVETVDTPNIELTRRIYWTEQPDY
jgi:type IV pilus assembly protein PilY1